MRAMNARIMQVQLFALVLLIPHGLYARGGTPQPANLPAGHPLLHPELWDQVLAFDDEFTGSALDSDKWGTTTQPQSADGFRVKDGALVLRVHNGQIGRRTEINTVVGAGKPFRQRYGWYEIRARMPRTPGFGTAFWLWEAGEPEPRSDVSHAAEIDIFEQFSSTPHVNTHSIHYGARPNGGSDPDHWAELFQDQHIDIDVSEDFHVYALEWTPDRVSFYIDDKLIGTSNHPADIAMRIILGATANVDAPAVFDDGLTVSYVRVYQLRGLPHGGRT
jgi:beta-glucanase (GH16 family)